ncbi:hypothetical protein DKK70_08785 [Gilliamella apicola]|uniref:Uncharacterized protein n=1 Tax=Gilliamella apicola TaxID=1196095 RepID=A0A2V4EFN3_9GAMM|nr:hypothetical protein DKK70_08785 [Gilliamella apicola]
MFIKENKLNYINNIIDNVNVGLAEQSKLSVKFVSTSENDGDTSLVLSILEDGEEIMRHLEVESIHLFSEPSYLKYLIDSILYEYS